MVDIIGVLGEATTVSIATTTVYTVPAGKAAKCQIMFNLKSGSDNNGTFAVTVNGAIVMQSAALTTVEYFNTSTALMFEDASSTSNATGLTVARTVAPAPMIYYLSAADTVTYTVATTALSSISIQVVGTEIDVT
jgi:hypothetical protein